MLTNSFCFLPTIGKNKEESIWKQGILTWEQFLQTETINGLSKETKAKCNLILNESKKQLIDNNSTFFKLKQESWRLYSHLKEDVLFLDIESDTKGPIVIGMYDKEKTMVMVKGVNMDKKVLLQALNGKKLIVSYNGSSFDLPRINKCFDIELNLPHIDLKGLCPRLGLIGGLKEIEKLVGIKRPEHLHGSPTDAWRAFFASGDKEYLDLIIQYNEEDTVNLHPLMEYVYNKLYLEWKEKYQ